MIKSKKLILIMVALLTIILSGVAFYIVELYKPPVSLYNENVPKLYKYQLR